MGNSINLLTIKLMDFEQNIIKMTDERIVSILCESFKNDVSVNYAIHPKKKGLEIFMRYSLFRGRQFGRVLLTEDHSTCAILMDPKKKKITLKSLLWDLNLVFRCLGVFNVARIMRWRKEIELQRPSGDYIHLWYIGVDKNAQGNGLGSQLLQQLISEYNSENRPIFLETSNPRSFPFYERLGFSLYKEINDFGYPLRMYSGVTKKRKG